VVSTWACAEVAGNAEALNIAARSATTATPVLLGRRRAPEATKSLRMAKALSNDPTSRARCERSSVPRCTVSGRGFVVFRLLLPQFTVVYTEDNGMVAVRRV
jgi:hypothetical protein